MFAVERGGAFGKGQNFGCVIIIRPACGEIERDADQIHLFGKAEIVLAAQTVSRHQWAGHATGHDLAGGGDGLGFGRKKVEVIVQALQMEESPRDPVGGILIPFRIAAGRFHPGGGLRRLPPGFHQPFPPGGDRRRVIVVQPLGRVGRFIVDLKADHIVEGVKMGGAFPCRFTFVTNYCRMIQTMADEPAPVEGDFLIFLIPHEDSFGIRQLKGVSLKPYDRGEPGLSRF